MFKGNSKISETNFVIPKISLCLLIKDVVLLTRIMKRLLTMEANINIILVQVSIVSLNKVWIVIKVHIYLDPLTQGNAGVVKI